MSRLLIIDSGATKADWALMDTGQRKDEFQTPGIHPFFLSDEEIRTELEQVRRRTGASIQKVFFYGTGCRAESSRQRLHDLFRSAFPAAVQVEIATDVLGAARALCRRHAGIACILGTGSNSVWYDGEQVVLNTGGYGYILGDEGSGAVLGRELLIARLNREMPAELLQAFDAEYPFAPEAVIEQVYRSDAPSRYLASFVPFLARHEGHHFTRELLQRQFALFLQRCVLVYPPARELPVHFTGSVAYHFRKALEEALHEAGLAAGTFLKAPMEGLAEFHK